MPPSKHRTIIVTRNILQRIPVRTTGPSLTREGSRRLRLATESIRSRRGKQRT